MRKEGLKDPGLVAAMYEMENGQIDARLGGKVFKKRIALSGRGKRGSVRTMIVYQHGIRAFFVYGFAKNERANIDANELAALKLLAKALLDKSSAKIEKDLKAKNLIEVFDNG